MAGVVEMKKTTELIKIIEKIEFKRGRCLVLDGKVWHSSSSPKESDRRMVINFNFRI